jgi:hypothetical protein
LQIVILPPRSEQQVVGPPPTPLIEATPESVAVPVEPTDPE